MLLNMRASAKAALMIDMAVPYDSTPGQATAFSGMRDSMYLLLAMNQYTVRSAAAIGKREAETLLRVVLFCEELRLVGTDVELGAMRRELAREVREVRKKGTVQGTYVRTIRISSFP